MDLAKRCQEITSMQSKLIKEWKDIDTKLDKKIVMKCTLEKAKFAILSSIHIPPQTSPQANLVAKITVPQSWPSVSKRNSDTWQIGDVKKIWKELFQFDDVDDSILATATAEAESTLLSKQLQCNMWNLPTSQLLLCFQWTEAQCVVCSDEKLEQIISEWKLVFHFNTCHFMEWIYKFSLCLV